MAGKKRRMNVKVKEKRARSYAKNQTEKAERIKDNDARAAHNLDVGSTGKDRRYNKRFQEFVNPHA